MAAELPVVRGVRWGSVEAGIRKRGGLDLGLVLCSEPAAAAAVFTQCHAAAAPVLLSRARVKKGRAAAILVNAGCANACAPGSLQAAERTTAALADALGAKPAQILVASTGVIGQVLPHAKVEAAIPALIADAREDGMPQFARAIMTTDLVPKTAWSRGVGHSVIAGCAKGAGMIMPNMATMLGFVATDLRVEPAFLRAALREAAHVSFNAVTVDGDTSTNDTLFLLATGASGVEARAGAPSGKRFVKALTEVCLSLAKAIAKDGEGATKRITVRVEGAKTEKDADAIARRIANSPLVKTAIHAADANWGRIVAAAGTAGPKIDPAKLSVALGKATVFAKGAATSLANEQAAGAHLQGDDVLVHVKLGLGKASRTLYTCDFSADYVKINAEYRT